MSDFHLPIELENNSTREILDDGEEIPVDTKKKQKRGEGNYPTPATRNLYQKEGMSDLWHLSEGVKFDSLFGDEPKGNTLVAKISNFKFRHHQKTGRSYKNTPLCIPFAVGQLCPKGKSCPKNHDRRKDLKMITEQ